MRTRLLAGLVAAVALAGCGDETVRELPPAAEPARAPRTTVAPVGRTIALPTPPEGVVADPRTGIVAVGLRQPDQVALVDGRAGKLLRLVDVPESPRHLQLEAPGGPVLVPAERANRLATIDLPSGRVRSYAVGAYPHDATAAGGRIFVGDEHGNTVTVLQDGRRTGAFRVATQPGGLTPVESGAQVAVVSVRERLVETYDTRTLKRTGRAAAGIGPTHVVSDGKRMLYVADTAGDGIVVIHTRPKLEVTRRVAFPGGAPYGIAIDNVRHRIWVTLTGSNEVVELRAGVRPGIERRFPTVRQPDTVAVDERTGRVFVTGLDRRVLQFFDPAKRRAR